MSAADLPRGGLFGKIPTKDDFVRRGLPLTFVTPWDGWLARMLSSAALPRPEVWTPLYLTSPAWRFALDPGIAGPEGWVGVMASSVDRFGRAFPLTVAVPFARAYGLLDLAEETQPVARALEGLALGLIEGSVPVEAAAEQVAALHLVPPPRRHPVLRSVRTDTERGQRMWILTGRCHGSVGEAAGDLLASVLREKARGPAGLTCWWHEGWGELPPASILVQGLPGGETYMRMMDGAWAVAPAAGSEG